MGAIDLRAYTRDVESEATVLWCAVDTLTTALSADLGDNISTLLEVRDKLDLIIERVFAGVE